MTLPSHSTKLRVALIGAGAIARDEHLPAWIEVPEAEVVALADASPLALETAGTKFGIGRRTDDYRTLLADRTIDAVDICAPSALHAEIAIEALKAGKHVLCEKPMATSRADAVALLTAWRASGKKLMIGQHFRFQPSIVQLRKYLERNPPGHVYFARAQWLRRRRLPARLTFTDKRFSGGGVLYDLGVHMLDLTWWLMGCPKPVSVTATTSNLLARRGDLGGEWGQWNPQTIDVEDFAAGMIRFENGAVLSLEVSWLALQAEHEFWKLQLLGTQAGVVWPEETVSGETDGVPWDARLSKATGTKAHHAVVHHFADAILNDHPVFIPPEQTATTIAILDAMYASSASGREVSVEGIEQ